LILAMGTEDPFADVATQAGWFARFEAEGQPYQDGPDERPHPVLSAVAGEVFTFDDPEARLPRLDALEGFRPGGNSLYRRVLVPVQIKETVFPIWLYVGEDPISKKFTSLGDSCWSRQLPVGQIRRNSEKPSTDTPNFI